MYIILLNCYVLFNFIGKLKVVFGSKIVFFFYNVDLSIFVLEYFWRFFVWEMDGFLIMIYTGENYKII